MQKILSALRGLAVRVRTLLVTLWKRFRALVLWLQAGIAVVVLALIVGLFMILGGSKATDEASSAPTVTLRTLAELGGAGNGTSVIGSVRSRSEASILAEAGGTVKGVNTTLGASVSAGYVIAELDNASERASVLQAEGAYDAAVASQASVSPVDAASGARNAYRTAFSTLDTTVDTYVDTFFGNTTALGPSVQLQHTATDRDGISRKRIAVGDALIAWRKALPAADTRDPQVLLTEAQTVASQVQALVEELARSATDTGSGATDAQLTALATARANVNGVVSSLTAAQASYRSNSTGSTASVDAGVKAALGTLRLAQANLERTIVRAPIAGTINFLPIRVGDYVTNLMHVATVAQNGALEIVAYVSEEARAGLSAGSSVTIEGSYPGTITSIAPALDPVTKQIEMHVAVTDTSATSLVNGQSVRIELPSFKAATAATSTGPMMLPLAAVKLSSAGRAVFTVGANSRLIAIPVDIGDVRGERIEITSTLPADTKVVTDARGLSEGQEVKVAQ